MRFNLQQRPGSLSTILIGVVALVALTGSVFSLSSCSRSDKEEDAAKAAPAKIEPIAGMKYYVGGPVMKYDKYGRMRLAGFNGEVSNPTTRGLLLGFKKGDDGSFDYRTWLNGAIISESTGFLDADGLLWYRERVSYDATGAVVVRQKFSYDEERKVMKSTLEHLDPADGKVVKTVADEVPFTPPAPAPDAEEDEEDSGDDPPPAAE